VMQKPWLIAGYFSKANKANPSSNEWGA
jgi:hypothetical protein